MDIKSFLEDWLAAANAYETNVFLDKWHENAVLDDPSVGKVFKGRSEIRIYFENYFIGYQTQTRLIQLDILNDNEAHMKVEFTGDFPGNKIRGFFDFTFKNHKIMTAKADLI